MLRLMIYQRTTYRFNMKREFRKVGHKYCLGDERIPSVTEIIQPLTDYGNIPPAILKNAADFGTHVHDMIALWLSGDLCEDTLDVGLKRPLEGFIAWYEVIKKYAGSPVSVEKWFGDRRLKYAGTPDLVFGDRIFDIKTRAVNPAVDSLQLEAYRQLVGKQSSPIKISPTAVYVLHIDPDGLCKTTQVYNKQAWGMFRKLLEHRKNLELIENWKGGG